MIHIIKKCHVSLISLKLSSKIRHVTPPKLLKGLKENTDSNWNKRLGWVCAMPQSTLLYIDSLELVKVIYFDGIPSNLILLFYWLVIIACCSDVAFIDIDLSRKVVKKLLNLNQFTDPSRGRYGMFVSKLMTT